MAPDRSLDLEPSLDAPSLARRSLQEVLSLWEAVDRADDAALLTSELVANAVRHAAGRIALRIQLDDHRLRVEVSDSDVSAVPRLLPRSATGFDTGGYGLRLVDELADEWGHRIEGDRKVVWFEFAVPASRRPAV